MRSSSVKVTMKKYLITFGLLDIISIFRSYKVIAILLTNIAYLNWLQVINLLFYIILGLSAFFLLRQCKVGLWLTYLQFPLRLGFMVLSLGFIIPFQEFFVEQSDTNKFLALALIAFEFLRLYITIIIHRKFYR